MYLKIKKVNFEKNRRGKNDVKITMIGLYEDDGKRVKWIKLESQILIDLIESQKIKISNENDFKY